MTASQELKQIIESVNIKVVVELSFDSGNKYNLWKGDISPAKTNRKPIIKALKDATDSTYFKNDDCESPSRMELVFVLARSNKGGREALLKAAKKFTHAVHIFEL